MIGSRPEFVAEAQYSEMRPLQASLCVATSHLPQVVGKGRVFNGTSEIGVRGCPMSTSTARWTHRASEK